MIETITTCDVCHYTCEGSFNTDILKFECGNCGEEYCERCTEEPETCSNCGGQFCGACMEDVLCECCDDEVYGDE